jgi:hypothetical protein
MTKNSLFLPQKPPTLQKLRRILQTDPVLPLKQLEARADLVFGSSTRKQSLEQWQRILELEGFALATRQTRLSVGARVSHLETFVCSSQRVSELTDWNLRQLAGLAALRYGLGIRPEHWQLRALERTNQHAQPIPDAMIHLARATNPVAMFSDSGKFQRMRTTQPATARTVIGVEWDSGSATRTELKQKILSYQQIAECQIWAVPTIARAKTIMESLSQHLPVEVLMVIALDWRTGKLLAQMRPYRGTVLEQFLTRVIPIDAPWYNQILGETL